MQNQVEGVRKTMAANIEILMANGEKLSDLDTRADELNMAASSFKDGARTVKTRMRWQKWKWYLICALVLALVFSGVITALVMILKN